MTIVTTGGRDFTDRPLVEWALQLLRPTVVAHGACSTGTLMSVAMDGSGMCGADGAVDAAAGFLGGMNVVRFPADWKRYGKSAGPMRNAEMLRLQKPDLVLAFPGGTGTADCCRQAKALGIRVLKAQRDGRAGHAYSITEWMSK